MFLAKLKMNVYPLPNQHDVAFSPTFNLPFAFGVFADWALIYVTTFESPTSIESSTDTYHIFA